MKGSTIFTIKILFLALLTISVALSLVVYTNNIPLEAAKAWNEAVLLGDYQIATKLTCKSQIDIIGSLIHPNTGTNFQDVDFSNITYKKSGSGNNFVIIDVRGTISAKVNDALFSQDINQRWQFIYEENQWKWCGYLANPESNNESVSLLLIGAISLAVIFLLLFRVGRRNDFSQFFSGTDDGGHGGSIRLQPYEIGWVRSFKKLSGSGLITNEKGESHAVHYSSIIGTVSQSLTNGEKVLFQKRRDKYGLRAENVIKTDKDSGAYNAYSSWLINLATRTKQLVLDFRIYKIHSVQSELNTCKAFLEQFNDYINKHNVKLENYEIVLLADVEKDVSNLSEKIRGISDKFNASWWAVILVVVLQMVDVIADIIQVASPQIAMLLRALGRGAGHLLIQRPSPPLIGPGDE